MQRVSLTELHDAPSDVGSERLDAIVITHSHGDHWHLPSILCAAPSADTLVVVPRVPRRSILTSTLFSDELDLAGQRSIAPAWGETIVVGDITIDVLPFYGEQPCADPPGPPEGLRSWGNCYRFNTPDFSAIVLVDSGRDPLGDVADVVRRSAEMRGPPDAILACMRSFASPFFGGLSSYWATLPFDRLRQLFELFRRGQLPSTTAGTAGLADICVASGAKHFLPYADGFNGVGVPIHDTGWGLGEPAELELVAELERRLASVGGRTRAVAWNPGDHVHFTDSGLNVERAC
jgi:hypothetical protein